MDECKNCANADNEYCFACDNGNQFKAPTNYDLLIRKSPEELADVLTDIGVRTLRLHKLPVTEPVIEQAKEDWLGWLKQEATDEILR